MFVLMFAMSVLFYAAKIVAFNADVAVLFVSPLGPVWEYIQSVVEIGKKTNLSLYL